MTTETTARKDTQKLQRAIVDGLEDVKAQEIQVFNTEHLSPLFERVIVASGTSNRQTKALAASVRDAVREAGFPKPRIEGEENGEWIIVDCGAAVAHIMQPAIRQYYHLEEIWGDKPIRLKIGAPKPAAPPPVQIPAKAPAKKTATNPSPSLRRASAAKTAVREAEAEAREAKASRAKPARAGGRAVSGSKGTAKTVVKSVVKSAVKAPGKAAGRTTARPPSKPVARKPAARKA